MLNKKQLLVLIVLSIFAVGMIMGSATAAHTVKCGKYKAKISNKQYKALKKAKKKGQNKFYIVKTGQYITFKIGDTAVKEAVSMTIGVSNGLGQAKKGGYVVVWCAEGPIAQKSIKI